MNNNQPLFDWLSNQTNNGLTTRINSKSTVFELRLVLRKNGLVVAATSNTQTQTIEDWRMWIAKEIVYLRDIVRRRLASSNDAELQAKLFSENRKNLKYITVRSKAIIALD